MGRVNHQDNMPASNEGETEQGVARPSQSDRSSNTSSNTHISWADKSDGNSNGENTKWSARQPSSSSMAPLHDPPSSSIPGLKTENFVSDSDTTIDREENNLPPKWPPALTGIDARIAEFSRNMKNLRTPVIDADTLVFIGRIGLENKRVEEDLVEYFIRQPLLVESSKLKALNSPYFDKYLGPFFVTRRWKSLAEQIKEYILPFDKGKKFILNLTPDLEGMEAVEAIQNLSCPQGVLKWKESEARWNNSSDLVAGIEENDPTASNTPETQEYSRVRHIKSIERFMLALQGQDPGFDTAAKLYTTVMVTKPWDIQGPHPLTNWTIAWLCADGNTKFVQALPETALKLAEVLRSGPLCKDAFGILVGEAVLASVTGHNDRKATFHERVRGDVEENWENRIQHARNSFMERIRKTFDDLAGAEMVWLEKLQLVQAAELSAKHNNRKEEYNEFLKLLRSFVRGSIYAMLSGTYRSMSESWQENGRSGGDCLYPRNAGTRAWPELGPQHRIYTYWFWSLLHKCHYAEYIKPSSNNINSIMTHFGNDGVSVSCSSILGTSMMREVSIWGLDEALEKCYAPNRLLKGEEQKIRKKERRESQAQHRKSSSVKRESTTTETAHFSVLPLQNRPWHQTSSAVNFAQPAAQHSAPSVSAETTSANTTSNDTRPTFEYCQYGWCVKYLTHDPWNTCHHCSLWYCDGHLDPTQHNCHAYKTNSTTSSGEIPQTSTSNGSSKQGTFKWNTDGTPIFKFDEDDQDASAKQHPLPGTAYSTSDTPTSTGRSMYRKQNTTQSESVRKTQGGTSGNSFTDMNVDPWSTDVLDRSNQNKTDAYTGASADDDDDSTASLQEQLRSFSMTDTTVYELLGAITRHFKNVAELMLGGVPGGNLRTLSTETHLLQTLISLNDEEVKYLPLWADGMDDESGGVFSAHVPLAAEGGAVLGPGGSKYATRSEGSEYSFASGSVDSTVNTSTLGHDGYRDTLPRRQVVAMDDSDSSSVGGWSFVQEKINNTKGKQPAIYTPSESEVATTLGDFDSASVINLGIKPIQRDNVEVGHQNQKINSLKPTPSTPQAASNADEDMMDDVFCSFDDDDEDAVFDDEEDSDMDIIDDEDLEKEDTSETTSASTNADGTKDEEMDTTTDRAGRLRSTSDKKRSSSRPTWELHDEARANTVYLYKGGDEDELMTRL